MMFDMDEMILPVPNPAFEWQQSAFGPALVCRPLAVHVSHVFTTRYWALGSRKAMDDESARWAEVAEAIGVSSDRLTHMIQVHGADAVEALPGLPPQRADIVVGGGGIDVGLAVQAADCVPLLLFDPQTGAAAAVHAGWRGLAAGVPGRAVDALARTYNARADDLIAAVGPSIGACCYEVGEDVRQAFETGGFEAALARWFHASRADIGGNPPFRDLPNRARDGHWYFDGWQCLRDQLETAGVRGENIFSPELCTASHAVFCSYRRDGAPAGRLAGALRVPSTRTSDAEGMT